MAEFSRWATQARVPLHFLLAALLVWLARPSPMLFAAGSALVMLGLLVRAWAAGHLRRDQPLTVSGPYAHVRHPLYFGSALVLAGFAVVGGEALVAIVAAVYFLVLFVPVLRREDEERGRASELHAAYAAQVPTFLPRLWPANGLDGSERRFEWAVFLGNREWRAEAGCALLLALLYARMVG
ncbi:MAG: methyltransferase family protein [Candidatus Acidiferrales bacterium]